MPVPAHLLRREVLPFLANFAALVVVALALDACYTCSICCGSAAGRAFPVRC